MVISLDHFRFLETAHLLLPYADINTYFPLWAKFWLRGGVGGQFPRNVIKWLYGLLVYPGLRSDWSQSAFINSFRWSFLSFFESQEKGLTDFSHSYNLINNYLS